MLGGAPVGTRGHLSAARGRPRPPEAGLAATRDMDNNTKQLTKYMYNPAMATITDALLASKVHMYVNLRTISAQDKFKVPGLDSGSVLICVGTETNRFVDWESLKSDGIYRIYYQTEAGDPDRCGPEDVDEIWDYSWANIDHCQKTESTKKAVIATHA